MDAVWLLLLGHAAISPRRHPIEGSGLARTPRWRGIAADRAPFADRRVVVARRLRSKWQGGDGICLCQLSSNGFQLHLPVYLIQVSTRMLQTLVDACIQCVGEGNGLSISPP